MIAVIFEVELREGRSGDYLSLAESLRPHLEQIDGFMSIERFRSLSQPGRLVSLSYWRDEEAVIKWRNMEVHRQAQEAGRTQLFAGYRIRVAEVAREYGNRRETVSQ